MAAPPGRSLAGEFSPTDLLLRLREWPLLFVRLLHGDLLFRRFTGEVLHPTPPLVAVLAIVLTVFFSISVGLFTAVMQVRHRDVRYSLRYVGQFWNLATPVIYPMSQIPPKYHFLMYLNPMAPLVETYKWGMLGIGAFPVGPFISAIVVTTIVFAVGVVFFYRSEAASVDKL